MDWAQRKVSWGTRARGTEAVVCVSVLHGLLLQLLCSFAAAKAQVDWAQQEGQLGDQAAQRQLCSPTGNPGAHSAQKPYQPACKYLACQS